MISSGIHIGKVSNPVSEGRYYFLELSKDSEGAPITGLEENFSDFIKQELKKFRYLMVIHNEVGCTLFNRKFGNWELDPDLIGRFLTDLQNFSSEIRKKQILIQKLEYRDFVIILEQRIYTLVDLFIDGKKSN